MRAPAVVIISIHCGGVKYVPSTAIESFALPKRSIQYSVLWLIAPNEK